MYGFIYVLLCFHFQNSKRVLQHLSVCGNQMVFKREIDDYRHSISNVCKALVFLFISSHYMPSLLIFSLFYPILYVINVTVAE